MTLLIYNLLLAIYNLINPMPTWMMTVSIIVGIVAWVLHLCTKGE